MPERRATIINETSKAWIVKIKASGIIMSLPKSKCFISNSRTNRMTGRQQLTFNIPQWLWDKNQ